MNRALALLTSALLVTSACDAADNTVADAAAAVVEDLLPRAPEGYTPYLAPEWQIPTSDTMEPLPAEVLEQLQRASGLPVAERGIVQSRDSSIVVLYLFRPVVVRSDSVRVLAGWMGLTEGDGAGAWGEEYDYLLDCRQGCRIVHAPRASLWN